MSLKRAVDSVLCTACKSHLLIAVLMRHVDQAAIYYSRYSRQQQQQQQQQPSSRNGTRKLSWKAEIRAAKWFGVVIAVFALCWLPLHVMNAVTLFAGRTNLVAVNVAVILSHANSAINPVLYAYSNTKFADAFRRILRLHVPQRFSSEGANMETATNVQF